MRGEIMSVSTDAQLYYGIQLDEGFTFPWYNEEEDDIPEWTDVFCRKHGIEISNYDTFDQYWDAKSTLMYEKLRCNIDSHCSGDYPMYYVCIKETEILASRGYPQEIDHEHFLVRSYWDQQLKDFCELMELPYSKPSWWLSSYWG
jgi:hypothetical protein